MQGRLTGVRPTAVSTIFVGASGSLGEFESGMLASFVGAVPAVVIGGFGSIAFAVLWGTLFPELRKRDVLVTQEAEATIAA